MMNKKIKNWFFLLLGIFIIIFIIPQVIHFLVYTPSPFGFIKPGEESQWIGFFGTVIGGSLTLVGVWWTLKNQDKKRKEDLAIQYKPIVIFKSDNEKDTKATIEFNYIKHDQYIFNFEVYLFNYGRGECFDFNISIEQIHENESQSKMNPSIQQSFHTNENNIIVSNGHLKYTAQLNILQFDKTKEIIFPLCFKIECQYYDFYHIKKYSSSAILKLELSTGGGGKCLMYIKEIENVIVKCIDTL